METLLGDSPSLVLQDYARKAHLPYDTDPPSFEMKGWKETQVVVRFWIITIVLVLIGLSTLKIR